MKFKLIESKINEKWYDVQDEYLPYRIWWSDSSYEFKNTIKNLSLHNGGYRLVVGKDTYAIASGMEMTHDDIYSELKFNLDVPAGKEMYTLGIPTIRDYDLNNLEVDYMWSIYQNYCSGLEDKFDYVFLEDQFQQPPKDLTIEQLLNYVDEHRDNSYGVDEHIVQFEGFQISYYGPGVRNEETFKQTELYKALKDLYIKY